MRSTRAQTCPMCRSAEDIEALGDGADGHRACAGLYIARVDTLIFKLSVTSVSHNL